MLWKQLYRLIRQNPELMLAAKAHEARFELADTLSPPIFVSKPTRDPLEGGIAALTIPCC